MTNQKQRFFIEHTTSQIRRPIPIALASTTTTLASEPFLLPAAHSLMVTIYLVSDLCPPIVPAPLTVIIMLVLIRTPLTVQPHQLMIWQTTLPA
jgi:hypothetical protein